MADVAIRVGDRTHIVACAPGEEARLERLGTMLAERFPEARRAAGNAGHERVLLLIGLLLADALDEALHAPPPSDATAIDAAVLERIAGRLETLAKTLEDEPAKP
jgi:cell division protein ZapA